jgi:hypothetical protein
MKTYFIATLIGCAMLIVALCVSLYRLRKMKRILLNMQKTIDGHKTDERVRLSST